MDSLTRFARWWTAALTLHATLLAATAERSAAARRWGDGSWLAGGYGMTGALDEKKVHGVFVHWRTRPLWHGLRLWAEGDLSTKGSPLFAGGGLMLYQNLGTDWSIAVSSGPGYFPAEKWLDLGSHLEFFSSIEVSRRIAAAQMVSVSVGHISNAGLGHRNPGSEVVRFGYQIELARLLSPPRRKG